MDDVDLAEPLYMIDNARFDMVNSKYALTSICNVLMNITVLETSFVDKTPIFYHILGFIMNTLPKLSNSGKYFVLEKSLPNNNLKLLLYIFVGDVLVLYGNFSVLGLLILKHHSRRPKSTDFSIYKFIQCIVT